MCSYLVYEKRRNEAYDGIDKVMRLDVYGSTA